MQLRNWRANHFFRNLILFNNLTSTGVSIPYPVISIHAIQRLLSPSDTSKEVQGLYMQLELEYEPAKDDGEPETTELILLLPDSALSDTLAGPIQILFEAVSSCSNLHPDPIFQDEDMEDMEDMDNGIIFEGIGHEGIDGLPGVLRGSNDGGLPPPFSGSSGWITAENVGEYFDEDGNWIGDVGDGKLDSLEGAGRVRGRDEAALLETNDHGRIEENKRLRVE
jgi:chloride channel, nucleotide-sensitive, 1A